MTGVDAVFLGIGIIGLCLLVEIMLTLHNIDKNTIRREGTIYESPNRGRH